METLNLKDLKLTANESKDIIKLIAKKRSTTTKKHCNIEMPFNDNNLIKYNQGEKSLKLPFVIYADLECLLKKIDTCQNNPDLSSTTKINQHIP